uniref:Small ribosomal subunit protein mS23 n=1 Tax=Melanaphis sacchari TaxID=742174 RepID=A0A2H8TRW8_9HEMI
MAGSRLEKLGTIFTRVNGLIKSGAMKVDDRPIWYDVYRAFPPESEPHYAKPSQSLKIPDIFYTEDTFRSMFHKETRGQLPPINLQETQQNQNVTNIAINMVVADPSLSVDQVIDSLKKTNVLPDYKTLSKKNQSSNNTR